MAGRRGACIGPRAPPPQTSRARARVKPHLPSRVRVLVLVRLQNPHAHALQTVILVVGPSDVVERYVTPFNLRFGRVFGIFEPSDQTVLVVMGIDGKCRRCR